LMNTDDWPKSIFNYDRWLVWKFFFL
jgi:hypothetical protein